MDRVLGGHRWAAVVDNALERERGSAEDALDAPTRVVMVVLVAMADPLWVLVVVHLLGVVDSKVVEMTRQLEMKMVVADDG